MLAWAGGFGGLVLLLTSSSVRLLEFKVQRLKTILFCLDCSFAFSSESALTAIKENVLAVLVTFKLFTTLLVFITEDLLYLLLFMPY